VIKRDTVRTLAILIAVPVFMLTQAGKLLGQEGEIFVEKYRKRGPDPMVSKIIEVEKKEEKIKGSEEMVIDTTGPANEDEPLELVIYKRQLSTLDRFARNAIIKREYEKVIHHCEEGIKTIKEIKEQKNIIIPQSTISSYEQNFIRWKRAAQEGIIQAEALENFKKRQITLEGIIWDEVKPIVILDGNSFKQNDPYKGVRIEKITAKRVDVIFMYKGRPFRYTLEFPEK
jgi:hypothetical protein